MPLKKPSRLPKHLNRTASPFVRTMAKKYYRTTMVRRRMRNISHGTRKWTKVASAIGSEFKVWAARISISIRSILRQVGAEIHQQFLTLLNSRAKLEECRFLTRKFLCLLIT
jgi:hypothetical protein